MIFNSLPFLVFVAIFIPLYFALKGRARLLLALAGSYLFYGWWDYRFCALMLGSSLLDFAIGWLLGKTEKTLGRRILLAASIGANLGLLGVFKYYNFFVGNFQHLMLSENMCHY